MPAHNITDNGGNLAAIKFPHPGCRFAGSLMWTWIIHELTKWIKDVIGGYSHHALRQQEVYGNTALSTQPVTASMMKSVCNSDENLSGFRRSSLACQTVRSAASVSRSRRLNPDGPSLWLYYLHPENDCWWFIQPPDLSSIATVK